MTYDSAGNLIAGVGVAVLETAILAVTVCDSSSPKERDVETELDYLINRYYSSTQGRFRKLGLTALTLAVLMFGVYVIPIERAESTNHRCLADLSFFFLLFESGLSWQPAQ